MIEGTAIALREPQSATTVGETPQEAPWLSLGDIARETGDALRTLQYRCSGGAYGRYQRVGPRGRYEVRIDWPGFGEQPPEPALVGAAQPPTGGEDLLSLPHQRQSDIRDWLALFEEFGRSGLKSKAFARQHGIPWPTWRRKRRLYEQGGGNPAALAPRRPGRPSSVPDSLFDVYHTVWQNNNKPSVKRCWEVALGHAAGANPDIGSADIPSRWAFHRRLVREVSDASRYYARNGWNKCRTKYGYQIFRDYSQVPAGTAWCSDHAQSDVAVICADGSIKFPWYTVWIDVKSYKWLGWVVHLEEPCSDHIAVAFRQAAGKYGIPEDVIIDNGKDYLARDIAGGRRRLHVDHNETYHRSIMGGLGIAVHFTRPYNARGKVIERRFREVNESFSRMCPGYRGPNTMAKPEAYEAARKRRELLTFEQFEGRFETFITQVHNKEICEGRVHQGRSPDHVWDAEYGEACAQARVRFPDNRALALFCRKVVTATITGNGVRYGKLGCWYWAEWMVAHVGERVDLRLERDDASAAAWVFRADTTELLGDAQAALLAPALAKSPQEKTWLKEAGRRQRDQRKAIEAGCLPRVDVGDILEHQMAAVTVLDAEAGHAPAAEPLRKSLALTAMDAAVRQRDAAKAREVFDPLSVLPADLAPRRPRPNMADDYIMGLGEQAAAAGA